MDRPRRPDVVTRNLIGRVERAGRGVAQGMEHPHDRRSSREPKPGDGSEWRAGEPGLDLNDRPNQPLERHAHVEGHRGLCGPIRQRHHWAQPAGEPRPEQVAYGPMELEPGHVGVDHEPGRPLQYRDRRGAVLGVSPRSTTRVVVPPAGTSATASTRSQRMGDSGSSGPEPQRASGVNCAAMDRASSSTRRSPAVSVTAAERGSGTPVVTPAPRRRTPEVSEITSGT